MYPSLRRNPLRLLAVAALVASAACRDQVSPLGPPRAAPNQGSRMIFDGAHSGGNTDVFFLFPLVPPPINAPGFGDPFQPGLPVNFKIRDISSAGTPVIKTFPANVVRMSDLLDDYHVLWDTRTPALDPNKTYRIEAYVGSQMVAFADVDVVTNLRQLFNVNTKQYVPLLDDFTLLIRIRIEQGWNCKVKTSCTTQLVTNTPPSGQTYTQVTTPDGENLAAFPANWFNPADAPNGVVVTVQDVTDELSQQPGGCALGKTTMLSHGHCVRFSIDPKLKVTNTVVLATCIDDPGDDRQLLFKYDTDESPIFLRNVAPPASFVCPENHNVIGSTNRSTNPFVNFASNALSQLGRAARWLVVPKSANAIDLGVGGALDIGMGFSIVSFGFPASMTAVEGQGQTGAVGSTLPVRPRVRITALHHKPDESAAVIGSHVTCTVTGGGGSVGGEGAASGAATDNGDGTYTCPSWRVGATAGANSLKVSAANLDDVVDLAVIGEEGPGEVSYPGSVQFTATATAGGLRLGNLSLQSTTLYIEGDGTTYNVTVSNGTGESVQNLVLQGWITQGDTRRAAGGVVLTCTQSQGELPPGDCQQSFSVGASNEAAGSGTLVSGDATFVLELRVSDGNGTLITSASVPITLQSP